MSKQLLSPLIGFMLAFSGLTLCDYLKLDSDTTFAIGFVIGGTYVAFAGKWGAK